MALNPDKLNEFLGKAVVDFGATMSAALIRIGDRLGLYKRWLAVARRHRRSLQSEPARQSATFVNGLARKRPVAT